MSVDEDATRMFIDGGGTAENLSQSFSPEVIDSEKQVC